MQWFSFFIHIKGCGVNFHQVSRECRTIYELNPNWTKFIWLTENLFHNYLSWSHILFKVSELDIKWLLAHIWIILKLKNQLQSEALPYGKQVVGWYEQIPRTFRATFIDRIQLMSIYPLQNRCRDCCKKTQCARINTFSEKVKVLTTAKYCK